MVTTGGEKPLLSQEQVVDQTEALQSRFSHHLERALSVLQTRTQKCDLLTEADVERAYQYVELALRPSATDLWPPTCAVMHELAPFMDQAGQRIRWVEHLVCAIDRCQQIDAQQMEAQLSLHLAFQYQKIGELAQSATLLERSIEHFSALNDGRNHGWALSQLANLARAQGQNITAVEYVERAFKLLEEGSFERHFGYSILGWLALNRGEVDQAIHYFEESLKLCKAHGEKRLAAMRQRSLGWAHCQRDEFDRAKAYLESSIETFDLLGDEGEMALSYINLGIVWSRSGQPDKALDLYAKAQPILQHLQDYVHLADLYNNRGMEYMALERWRLAEDSFLLGAKFYRDVNNIYYLCSTLSNLADAYIRSGQKDNAISVLQEALSLTESSEQDASFALEQSKMEQKLAKAFGM